MTIRQACILVALVSATLTSTTLAQTKKPKLPPGLDPGGPAVAVLTSGIDYTRPDLSSRLARDGEGDLIGWDTIDSDNRPYDSSTSSTAMVLALMQAKSLRIIPIRVAPDTPTSLDAALKLIAQMPTRVVVVTLLPVDQTKRNAFLVAAAQLRDRLFIVTAGTYAGETASATSNDLGNIVEVAAASEIPSVPEQANVDAFVRPTVQGGSGPVIEIIPALFACSPRELAHLAATSPKLDRLISALIAPTRTPKVDTSDPCRVYSTKR